MIKPWPCCGGNHEALTAIFDIIENHNIKSEEVESITVATSWRPPGPCISMNPKAALEGKFSMQYNIASAIVDRKIDLDTYIEKNFARSEVWALMKRVNYIRHPECTGTTNQLKSRHRFAEVSIKLYDGNLLSERQS